MEAWTSAAEGLEACRADIESKEARLAEDVGRFELELSRRNEEIAAEKVTSKEPPTYFGVRTRKLSTIDVWKGTLVMMDKSYA